MYRKLTLLSVLLFTNCILAAPPTEFRGTVTDAMCGRHHMKKNASAAECTRTCVKSGSDFALASGDKLYTLKGDRTQLDKFAGADVIVSGELNGNALTVKDIRAAH